MLNRRNLLAAAGLAALAPFVGAKGASAAAPSPALGRMITLPIASSLVAPRSIFVWLPEGYDENPWAYPVLYAPGGEALFADAPGGSVNAPGIDEHVAGLAFAGEIRVPIIVAIGRGEQAVREFLPAAPVAMMPPSLRGDVERQAGGPLLSDRYVRFIASELKPMIDGHFRTLPGAADTAILGSGLAGLASLYALMEYPLVFGAAGCLSERQSPVEQALSVGGATMEQATSRYLKRALPSAGTHRLYVDFGDVTHDQAKSMFHKALGGVAHAKGYVEGFDLISAIRESAEENEMQRIDRTDTALTMLLGGRCRQKEGRSD